MRRFLIFVLALLASTVLSASLAACAIPEGGYPSLRVSPSSSPTSTDTPKPTETPTPTPTATPTEVPLPSEFLAQAQEHGFPYKIVDGKVMVDLVDGSSVEVNPAQVGDWPMWENNYLVIKGDNGIPLFRFVEGKGWESVEQTSMLDAYGNTVPGWVVETSLVWDGEPTVRDNRFVTIAEYSSPDSGSCVSSVLGTVKQWKLLSLWRQMELKCRVCR